MPDESIGLFTLSNGLRVVFKSVSSGVAHCGLMIHSGSRDELIREHGLAHFIEHNLFKGTRSRKSFHILSRIDSVGGELNAYTAKEEMCMYASFQKQYLERATELLADVFQNSIFPDSELQKEKDVIIDEISSYMDTPSEQIFDDFEALLFRAHPLGRSILGAEETVKSFSRQDILNYTARFYVPENMVFSCVGPYKASDVFALVDHYFNGIKSARHLPSREPPGPYKPFHKEISRNGHQVHSIIGNRCLDITSSRRMSMILLNNMLGGPSMNSRLNLNIRERYGFTYYLESGYSAFTDTGVFTIYLGTDKKHFERTTDLVKKELRKLRDNKIGTRQLSLAKKQLVGNIAMGQESNSGVMTALAKSLLLFGHIEPLADIYRKVERITAEELLELANRFFDEKKLSQLTYTC